MKKIILLICIPFGLFTQLSAQNTSNNSQDTFSSNDFGDTLEDLFNFTGEIYYLPKTTTRLPNFSKLSPVGKIYTKTLNIKNQSFKKGFPGVSDRFEFFAIDYKGKFYINEADTFGFILGSDDGSKLFIDDSLLIDNDFRHSLQYKRAFVFLSKGTHSIEVQYYQGSRYHVALILRFRKKSEEKSYPFDLTDFYPITIKENGDSINIEISDEILFSYNSFKLSNEAKQALKEIKRVVIDKMKLKSLIINGHTDDIGSIETNLKLSKRRAKAVSDFFTVIGIDAKLLRTIGYGESKPKFPNIDDLNRKKNRRIELTILK